MEARQESACAITLNQLLAGKIATVQQLTPSLVIFTLVQVFIPFWFLLGPFPPKSAEVQNRKITNIKQFHMNVLLNSFHLNGYTRGFHPET